MGRSHDCTAHRHLAADRLLRSISRRRDPLFLAFGSYARKETVPGYLTPVTGIAKVSPSAPGVVAELFVADGGTGPGRTAPATGAIGTARGAIEVQAPI